MRGAWSPPIRVCRRAPREKTEPLVHLLVSPRMIRILLYVVSGKQQVTLLLGPEDIVR